MIFSLGCVFSCIFFNNTKCVKNNIEQNHDLRPYLAILFIVEFIISSKKMKDLFNTSGAFCFSLLPQIRRKVYHILLNQLLAVTCNFSTKSPRSMGVIVLHRSRVWKDFLYVCAYVYVCACVCVCA